MKFMKFRTFIVFALLLAPALSSAHVWFFYSSSCPHCHAVLSSGVLDEVNASVEKYSLDFNTQNQEKFTEVINYYSQADRSIIAAVPTALVFDQDWRNGTIIQGDKPIIDTLPQTVDKINKQEPGPAGNVSKNVTGSNTSVVHDGGVTPVERNVLSDLALVVGTGLADSVNPCIMAVLGLLLATLTSMKADKKEVITLGALYTFCVYVSYFIIGLIIFAGAVMLVNQFSFFAMSIMGIAKALVALFIVIAAAVNIKDYFWYGRGFSFSLNEKQKKRVMKLIKRMSVPAILLLGVFVTIVEFPCSGMMYLGIITYFVSSGINPFLFFTYLIIYNLLFVLPLIIITAAVVRGKSVQKVEKFRLAHRRQFRLIMGIGLLILAAMIMVV